MKKKAKFVVEILYDEADKGLTTENVNIVKCESEGDFKGLVLALTAGLAFTADRGESPFEIFQSKLRLLRATGSALMNCVEILKSQNALQGRKTDAEMTDALGGAVKHTVDLITYGIAIVLGMTDRDVERCNDEYIDSIDFDNSIKPTEDEQGQRNEQRGTEQPDSDDFL